MAGWEQMTRPNIRHHQVQLDYSHDTLARLGEDFYRYSRLDIPLTFLLSDILEMMATTYQSYFKLGAAHASDGRDHYFHFKVRTVKEVHLIRVYQYVGHSFTSEKPFLPPTEE